MRKLQHGRQDLSDPESRTSADHQSEQSAKYEETRRSHLEDTRRRKHLGENHSVIYKETCRGNAEYRIQGIPSLNSSGRRHDSQRNQLSIYGAVADLSKELSKDSEVAVKPAANEDLESMEIPTDRENTDSTVREWPETVTRQ